MDRDRIDASVGLDFTLTLLKGYQENGLLQATLMRLPGISGKCDVLITIVNGEVTSCLAKDLKRHTTYTVDLQALLKLDNDRGPFEWRLSPLATPERTNSLYSSQTSFPEATLEQNNAHAYKPPGSPIPRIVAQLNFSLLASWTPEQKRSLFMLYALIDGNRTVDDIKKELSLPAPRVEEGLRILLSLRVIAISL